MAMLAEPRNKRKISINPNGNAWSNDTTKFGQKLLKKFGWSEGKGLGVKEDGISDHIKVDYKFGNKGVGYKKDHSDNWIAHQDDFNAILANLNEGNSEQQASVSSIESASKKSRSRVHYQKFVKGKDLSHRSATDLNSIFGVRKEKKKSKQKEEEEEAPCEKEVEADSGSLVTYNSTQSLQEYFAQKMAEKRRGSQPIQTPVESINEEVASENRSASEKKKNKKKRKNKLEDTEDEDKDARVGFYLDDESEKVEKKRKKRNASDEEGTLDTSVGDEECVKKSKKSKKKKKERKDPEDETSSEDMAETMDGACVKESDKTQEKYTEEEQQTEAEGNDCLPAKLSKKRKSESCEDVPKKKKKKSKKGESSVEMTTDGRARRVVFDSEGNLERVENTQETVVNITKESYMKTFMPNYTEKIKTGGSEKQPSVKKAKTKRLQDKSQRVSKVKTVRKSEESSWKKPKHESNQESVSQSYPVRRSVTQRFSNVKTERKSEESSWSKPKQYASQQKFVQQSYPVRRPVAHRLCKENSVVQRARDTGTRVLHPQRPSVQTRSNWQGSRGAMSNDRRAPSMPVKRATTYEERMERKKKLEEDIITKLPSIVDLFKSKGASMHDISGVYVKPVEKEITKEKPAKTGKQEKTKKKPAKKGQQKITKKKPAVKPAKRQDSSKQSKKTVKKRTPKKKSNKPKALTEADKLRIEQISETKGKKLTRHQLKKSLWYSKQKFKK